MAQAITTGCSCLRSLARIEFDSLLSSLPGRANDRIPIDNIGVRKQAELAKRTSPAEMHKQTREATGTSFSTRVVRVCG